MSDIYFFADQVVMDSQQGTPGDEAFGPVQGNKTKKFRVTSLHSGISAANPAAYAVCRGAIRAQDDEKNSALLTLVLRPDAEILPGVPITYFVYRGIRRDSLIVNGELKPGIALTEKLLQDELPQTDPLKKHPDRLGLAFRSFAAAPLSPDFERADGDAIDTLFFETTDLKPILVGAGDLLGEFDGASFGFEIMLRSIWQPPSLGLLRKVPLSTGGGNIIDVSGDIDPLARAKREKVYGYLDPCAFYGMCFDRKDGVKYRTGASPGIATVNAKDLYDKLLVKFHRRNTVYLDVRNDNGLSYNYYDNYGGGEVLLGLNSGLLESHKKDNLPLPTSTSPPYTTDDWPLKIIDSLHDPIKLIVPPAARTAGIRLALRIGTAGAGAVQRQLFLEFARLYYNQKGKKREKDSLLEPGANQRLIDVTAPTWTADVVLGVPVVDVGGSAVPMAFHTRLRYLRQNESQPSVTGRYISTGSPWDNLFALRVTPSRWKNDHSSNWWLTGHLKYVQPALDNQQVYKGMAEAGIAIDTDPGNPSGGRYTFYYVPVHAVPEPADYRVTRGTNPAGTAGSGTRTSFFQRIESGTLYDGTCYLTPVKQTEFNTWSSKPVPKKEKDPDPDPVGYLSFVSYLESVRPDDQKEKNANPYHSKESVYAMAFSAAEYEALLGLAVTGGFDDTLHPIFLQVRRRVFPRNDDTATRRAYQALELRLTGFDHTGNYSSIDVPSTILPISLPADGMIFCTNDAAAFEPLEVKPDVQICTQVRHESVTSDTEHDKDVLYFARAIADLKRYAPAFYQEMQNLQLEGAEVMLHDDPGVPKKRRYRIKVTFDDWMRRAPAPQVAVTVRVPHLPEQQVESQVTQPVRAAMLTIAGVVSVASQSLHDTSRLRINFAAGTNAKLDRQAVENRLNNLQATQGASTQVSVNEIKDSSGETSTIPFFGNFPGQTSPDVSTSGFKISGLQTLGDLSASASTILQQNDSYGFGDPAQQSFARRINESRYVALNADRHLTSTQVRTAFFSDYTHAEIDANDFDPTKLYLESEWKADKSGSDTMHRISLADLKNLGLGTNDPERPITIQINRQEAASEAELDTTKTYSPRRAFISTTLCHELGHADKAIREPLLDKLWGLLESIFDGIVTNLGDVTTGGGNLPGQLTGMRLRKKADYPNPPVISHPLGAQDAQRSVLPPNDRNTQLSNDHFLAKTGGGHLRGSPTGQRACEVERPLAAKIYEEINNDLKKWQIANPQTITLVRPGLNYCFLNYDDADLNPNDQ